MLKLINTNIMRVDNHFFKTIFLLFFVLLIVKTESYGQSNGLWFSSYGVVQDNRTSFNLSPDKPFYFKDNFEISFDLSFIPNQASYFGYVLRIIENNNENIDLINNSITKNRFNLIIGEKLSKISFNIDSNLLYSQWSKLHIKFDLTNGKVTVYSGNRSFTESNLHLKKNGYFKIFFGVNNHNQFQTTDTPPMKVRDVRITENGKVKYYWPLNEERGTVAHEIIAQSNGAVINPSWIAAMHHDWRLSQTINVSGPASVAFNPQKQTVYIVGSDSIYTYSVSNLSLSAVNYVKGRINLNIGNQSAFNPYDNHLYNIYPDQKFVAKFNFETRTWDKKFIPDAATKYWQFNKVFSATDTSLYLFDGYGYLRYKNEVQQYHLNSGKWKTVTTKGDFFAPRYLAALGSTSNGDTAYLVGGYGNESGMQIINPKNMYDMLCYTVADKKFKKLFDLNVKEKDFTFANSLIIDEKAKMYYGLVYPEHKYNSTLQLICGSLTQPTYSFLGSNIPYLFHDTNSFVDLYYCPDTKEFVAVTLLLTSDNRTLVNIYTLLGPPYESLDKIKIAANNGKYYLYLIVLILAIGVIIIGYKMKKSHKKIIQPPGSVPSKSKIEFQSHELNKLDQFLTLESTLNGMHAKSAVFLFGDMQIIDATGTDITKLFTPVIKELFLVIILYSLKRGTGLTSEKLNEILWHDKSAKSAGNNRSVSITKLKSLLEKIGPCHLSKDTGYWKIDYDPNAVYVDYYTYLQIIKDKNQLDIKTIKCLIDIVQRGNFLSNIDYEWLHTFKSEISNEVIDKLLHFINSATHKPELLIEITNLIFYFDPVNEEAMVIKCKALSALGKHSLAKDTFESFSKEYKVLYDEEFKKTFHDLTE
ncbi:MAG: galactose oxidase [Mucilaginibacter sp.]|nr:galactose oxidase [Mucilaginibacter sp.]